MTWEIGFLFALIVGMVYLFLTEKIPVELTAFLGLVIMLLTGLGDLTPEEGFSGFSSRDVQILRETKCGDAINNTEVDFLGLTPHSRLHAIDLYTKHFCRRGGVNVPTFFEGLHHTFVFGEGRHNSQLDLRIIR